MDDVLLDTDSQQEGMGDEEDVVAQDITNSWLRDEHEGQGPLGNVVLPDPSSGERQKLSRVEVNKVVLVDTKVQSMRGSVEEEAMLRSQDIVKPDSSTPSEGHGGWSDANLTMPSVAKNSSLHSQPASQPPTQRCTCTGQNILAHVINNVTLGILAGACQVGGEGHPVTPQRCTHSMGGVCSIHGPGAKWCWKPIPVGKRKPGPNGKLVTKEYYWRCDVSMTGKKLKQTRISFGKTLNDEKRGDNVGTRK